MMITSLFVLLLTVVAIGLGRWCIRALKLETETTLEEVVFAAGLGFALIGYATLLLGAAGLWYTWTAFLLVGVAAIVAVPMLWNGRKALTNWRSRCQRPSMTATCLGAVLAFHIISNYVATLAPVTYSDALRLHIAVPKLWIQRHGLAYLPSVILSDLAHLAETLYTLCMLLRNEFLASQLHFIFGVLDIVVIYAFARRYLSGRVGLLAAALFYGMPLITDLGTGPYTDLVLILYTSLTIYSLANWSTGLPGHWLAASGVFAGLALSTKVTGGFALVAAGATLIWFCWRSRKTLRYVSRSLLVFGGIAALIAAPWYIKSWVLAGNPVFPALYGVFGGRDWNAALDAIQYQVHGSVENLTSVAGIAGVLLVPWTLVMQGMRFGGPAASYTPIFTAVVPCFWYLRRRLNTILAGFLVYAVVFGLLWYFVYSWGRWMLPTFFGLSILTAFILAELAQRSQRLAIAVVGCVAITLGFGLVVNVIHNVKYLPVVTGLESRDSYLQRNVWSYDVMQYANHNLPPDARVLLWNWLIEGFYLERDYVFGNPAEQGYIDCRRYHSAEEALTDWRQKGITHIIWDKEALPETLDQAKYRETELVQAFYRVKTDLLAEGYLRSLYKHTENRLAAKTLERGARLVEVELLEVVYPK